MHGENLRKFTESRAVAPHAIHALILPQPRIQYCYWLLRQNIHDNIGLNYFLIQGVRNLGAESGVSGRTRLLLATLAHTL
jgi:hypothetical protein